MKVAFIACLMIIVSTPRDLHCQWIVVQLLECQSVKVVDNREIMKNLAENLYYLTKVFVCFDICQIIPIVGINCQSREGATVIQKATLYQGKYCSFYFCYTFVRSSMYRLMSLIRSIRAHTLSNDNNNDNSCQQSIENRSLA